MYLSISRTNNSKNIYNCIFHFNYLHIIRIKERATRKEKKMFKNDNNLKEIFIFFSYLLIF